MYREASQEDLIVLALRRISQAVETYSRFLWQEYHLTAPQLGTLRELSRCLRGTPSALAERMFISPPTMAGILKRLESRGLVSRLRDPEDRRSVLIRLTDAGRELSDRAPSLLRDRFRQELASLADWERTQILSTLQRVGGMLGAEEVTESPFLFVESVEPAASTSTRPTSGTEPPAEHHSSRCIISNPSGSLV
jgi:DNA-binding MarR family transcriptional regulator